MKTEELMGENLLNYVGFIVASTSNSYVGNDDGDGMYFTGTNKLVRSKNKINPLLYIDDIGASDITLTHQRISTSGKTEEYTQPFQDDEFVLAHNGVLSQFVDYELKHSDTYNLFEKFKTYFKEMNGRDREERIKRTIQVIFDEQFGSYSIFIYDKIGDKLYYFKNKSTSIYLTMNKKRNIAYMTTDDDNNKMLTLISDDFKEYEIEDLRIYSIETIKNKNNSIISIKKIGKIKEYEYRAPTKIIDKSNWDNEFDEYNRGYKSYVDTSKNSNDANNQAALEKMLDECRNSDDFYDNLEKKKAQGFIKDVENKQTTDEMSILLVDKTISEKLSKVVPLAYDGSRDICHICGWSGNLFDVDTDVCICNKCVRDKWTTVIDVIYIIHKALNPKKDIEELYKKRKEEVDDTNKKISEVFNECSEI